LIQITKKEKGSPVDVAKSYMHNRPAWASPSLKFTEVGSPSPLGVQRLMEETPKSALRSSEVLPPSHIFVHIFFLEYPRFC